MFAIRKTLYGGVKPTVGRSNHGIHGGDEGGGAELVTQPLDTVPTDTGDANLCMHVAQHQIGCA